MYRTLLTSGLTVALLSVSSILAAAPAEIVASQCASCHAVDKPDYATLGRAERLTRKAPPLYFAGNKYRQEWLTQYLQTPYTLYPSGYFPERHLLDTAEGDRPDADALVKHVSLSAADAAQVSEYLMALRPYDELIEQDNYEEGKVAKRMGSMDFRKFKGCDACHQDSTDNGGFSGPQLYDAWQRLQPEYLSSFLKKPLLWDPNTTMPVPQMNEQAVHKLVDYLKVLGEE